LAAGDTVFAACNKYKAVLGTLGWHSGRHQWSIQGYDWQHLITGVALESVRSCDSFLGGESPAQSWLFTGNEPMGSWRRVGEMQHGDTLQFTLDCEAGTLDVHWNGSHKPECQVVDLQGKTLYPVVGANSPSSRAILRSAQTQLLFAAMGRTADKAVVVSHTASGKQEKEEQAEKGSEIWMYQPPNDAILGLLAEPDIDGEWTAARLKVNDEFYVSEQHLGGDGIRYLKLADGRGWALEFMPGVGTLCVKKDENFEEVFKKVLEAADEKMQPEEALRLIWCQRRIYFYMNTDKSLLFCVVAAGPECPARHAYDLLDEFSQMLELQMGAMQTEWGHDLDAMLRPRLKEMMQKYEDRMVPQDTGSHSRPHSRARKGRRDSTTAANEAGSELTSPQMKPKWSRKQHGVHKGSTKKSVSPKRRSPSPKR